MPAKPRLRLYIVDPSMVADNGHSVVYCLQLGELASRGGMDVAIYCHKDYASGDLPFPHVPYFSMTQYVDSAVGELEGARRRRILAFSRELSALFDEISDANAIVYFPTVNELLFFAICAAITKIDDRRRPHLVINLMFPAGLAVDPSGALEVYDRFSLLTYGSAFAQLRDARNCVSLLAFGEERGREFGALFGEPIVQHPILINDAISSRAEEIARNAEAAGISRPARVLLYAGDAKEEKGFLVVPEIAESLADHPVLTLAHANLFFSDSVRDAAAEKLRALAAVEGNFSFREDRLGEVEYANLIADCDVIVLPYDREAYRYKCSSILFEGVKLNKTLVVPEGTWLERECKFLGFDHFTFDGGASEIVEVILRAARHVRGAGRRSSMRLQYQWGADGLLKQMILGHQVQQSRV